MKIFVLLLYCPLLLLVTAHLDGEYHRCSGADGSLVSVPGITDPTVYPCIVCTCTRGRVTCQNKRTECPSTRGCANVLPRRPGQCCEECAGCSVGNATQLRSGSSLVSEDEPCSVTQCHDGVVTSHTTRCDTAQGCTNPILVPGHCCPVCPQQKCELGGHILEDGETRQDPDNRCRECTCEGGFLTCHKKTCPVLSCREDLQKTFDGDCCPVCSRQTLIKPRRQSCLWRNEFYRAGDKLPSDTCSTCHCSENLTPTCAITCQAGERQTCQYEGNSYSHGDSWYRDKCTTCSCKLGSVKCEAATCPTCPGGTSPVQQPGKCCPACSSVKPPQPLTMLPPMPPTTDGVCTVFGDPHYKTFDGKIFNFQGSCKYLLTSDCGSNSSFSIRITNDARSTLAFSWLRTVTVRMGDTKVSLLQKMRVKVDGKKVTLPYIKLGVLSVMKDGYRVILRTNEGVRLLWDGVSFLELTVPGKLRGNMCGLCGNFNGDKRDDFVGRHGALMSSGQEFGNSWRVGGKKACSVLPRDVPLHPPTCKNDWEGSIRSDKHCSAIKSSLFARCHSKVPPQFYFKACRIDMCECPGTQCHCEVLTAYARECERAGIRVSKWREETGCRNVKPFKYSAEHASGENSATRDINANLNEVITDTDTGLENLNNDEEEEDEPLDLRTIHNSLPAYRLPNAQMSPLTSNEQFMSDHKGKVSNREKSHRRRNQRRRRPRNRNKNKEPTFVRKNKKAKESSRSSLGSFKGFTVERIGNGGSRRRLKWGGKKKMNLIDMLLSSDEDVSREDATSENYDDTEYNDDYEDIDNDSLTISDLPYSKQRSKPPPLHESGDSRQISLSSSQSSNLFFSNPSRRNYKRRREERQD